MKTSIYYGMVLFEGSDNFQVTGDTTSMNHNMEIIDSILKEHADKIDQQKQDKGDYALKTDIPSLDGYATETYVGMMAQNALETVNEMLTAYALKTDIPSDTHINDLIDAKLTPLEDLSSDILEVM